MTQTMEQPNVIGVDFTIREPKDRNSGSWLWVTMSRKFGFSVHSTPVFPSGVTPEITTEEQKQIDALREYFDSGKELTIDAVSSHMGISLWDPASVSS